MSKKGFFRVLKKSNIDFVFTGVCGGLGENTQVPAWTWRVLFLLSISIGGFGFLVYLLLAIFMPSYYAE